jgi:hypothetical protein
MHTSPRSVPVGRWLRAGVTLDAALYVLPPGPAEPPDWVRPLSELADEIPVAASSSPGAVLLFRAAGRMFAVPFGRGHFRLRADRLVDDFGLRVAADLLDANNLLSVDSRAIEQTVFLTRRGASRGAGMGALGLEADREAISSLTGRPRDEAHGTRVTGRTGFMTTRPITPDALPGFAADALATFAAPDYLAEFGALDRRRRVDDEPRARELTEHVIDQLQAPGHGGAYLAAPEVLDWANVGGFRFSFDPRGSRRQEITLADYHAAIGGLYTYDRLLEDRVTLFARDGRPAATWSVLKCLIAEQREADGVFVLSEERWWQVHADYIAEIDALVGSIPRADVELVDFGSEDTEEGAYNRHASRELAGSVALDQRFASFKGEKGRIELCDIAGPGKRLIHVKRGLRAYSLSHLFAQAVGSAEALRNLRSARERLRELLQPHLPEFAASIDADSMHASEWEVVIGIVSDEVGRTPGRLPFFSRAHLARSARFLRRMDYEVAYRPIGVSSGRPESAP